VGGALRRDLGLALCEARIRSDDTALEKVLGQCEATFRRVQPAERERLELWAVEAAEVVGRPDLAGRAFAASFRAGTPGAAERWRQWADRVLGDTFGVPGETRTAEDGD
jgi:hypothetical protein